ncbi:hypothetical protein [Natronomonas sp. EA1]|uniref:hypothetical protein n=1 Tax=Natronomonas sp. EA1 TaxID=3421655 RepID=UPI003EBC9F1C
MNRRAFLAAAAGASLTASAGCLRSIGFTRRGYVRSKTLTGFAADGEETRIIQVAVTGDGGINAQVAERHAGLFEDPKHPEISGRARSVLQNAYSSLRVELTLCALDFPECETGTTGVSGFNQVQVYDAAEVFASRGGFSVLAVEDREDGAVWF